MADRRTKDQETLTITVDGKQVEARKGEYVIAAAERNGVYIPRFCYHPRMRSVAMCRMCVVEINGRLTPACFAPVQDDQKVVTTSDKVKKVQDGVLEFLLANHPLDCPVCDRGGECPLQDQTLAFGPGESRFVEEKRHWAKPIALSSLVDLDRERCIQCDRCTRFADEVAGDALIKFVGRSDHTEINTFPDRPFASYFSGNTVQICPVGALLARPYRFRARPWDLEQVESTCTSCAFGCRVAVQSSANRLTRYLGIDNDPVNHGWLCDMGRFDFEAVNSAERVSTPLVRRLLGEGGENADELVEASWGDALAAAAKGLGGARSVHGPGAIAVVGGARLANEDAYAWAKLAKGVLGTDNVDAQLDDGVPAEAVLGLPRATIAEACEATAVVLLGPDVKEELPVLYLRLKAAALDDGVPMVELAPQRTGMSRYCKTTLLYRPGEAPALARALTAANDPAENVAGVEAGAIADARRLLRPPDGDQARVVVVLGRPSVAERGESVAAAAAALAEGIPGVRFLPALRRANVMGALDMGLAPGVLPGRVGLAEGTDWVLRHWPGAPAERGVGTREIMAAAAEGRIQGLVLLGADPVADFPDRQLARQALAGAGFVVAVDTFLTGSSSQADVVLPAAAYGERPGTTTNIEGRISRLGQKVVPPGVAWPDWLIAAELASRLGGDLAVDSLEAIWDEIERVAPSHAGVTRAALTDRRNRDGIVAPLGPDGDAAAGQPAGPSPATATDVSVGGTDEEPSTLDPMATPGLLATLSQGDPATAVAPDRGPTDTAAGDGARDGAGRPALLQLSASPAPPAPPPPDAYSLRLVAGRTLYGQGTLVQRSPSLAPLAPAPVLRLHPSELERLGLPEGGQVRIRGRASFVVEARPDAGVPRGSASLAFNAGAGGRDAAGLASPGERVPGAGDLIDAGALVNDVRIETV